MDIFSIKFEIKKNSVYIYIYIDFVTSILYISFVLCLFHYSLFQFMKIILPTVFYLQSYEDGTSFHFLKEF